MENPTEIIVEAWGTTEDNLLVNAGAGTGKTTTILKIIEKCATRVLYLAFNKSIQEEVESKFISRGYTHAKALTFHRLGMMLLSSKYSRIFVNKSKYYKMVVDLQKKTPWVSALPWKKKAKLTFSILALNDVSRMYLEPDIIKVAEIAKEMGKTIELEDSLVRFWDTFLVEREKSYTGRNVKIDFVDMIYLPVKFNIALPPNLGFNYLMIDEAQDLGYYQHKFVDLLLSNTCVKRWVAVGDNRQSIYGFAGAFPGSIDLFKSKSPVELDLNICYRCDKAIIESANEIYDFLIPREGAGEGVVETVDDFGELDADTMVICRNTNPLIDVFLKFLKDEVPCFIEVDDVLGPVIQFLRPYKKYTTYSIEVELAEQLSALLKKPAEKVGLELFLLKENISTFKKLRNGLIPDKSILISDFIVMLEDFAKRERVGVRLCTIHKSKGLEAKRVYFVGEKELIPSKFAYSEDQLTQEKNLKWVGRSRAINELYFIPLAKNEK